MFPSTSSQDLPQALLTNKISTSLWHVRFEHPSYSTALQIINNNILPCHRENSFFCNDCVQAKACVLPFSISSSFISSPLELIHSDVWGSSPIVYSQGYKYYITFIDDYSYFT
jgi:GAG-pre-integrase domain